MGRLEDLLLRWDRRGVSALRPFLPPDFCMRASRFLWEREGPVLIATGFYISYAGAVETDGPPGAVALGRALSALGRRVVYLTDRHGLSAVRALAEGAKVVEFPLAGPEESEAFARRLLEDLRPAVLVSVERCGAGADGRYRNMRGQDITAYTARLDPLFLFHPATVGVGDGGNEIGMGAVAEHIPRLPSLPDRPCVTPTAHLVIASVSNWGAYGLAAGLSRLAGRDLLPRPGEATEWVRALNALGVVDSASGRPEPAVDGFPVEEGDERVVADLKAWLAEG